VSVETKRIAVVHDDSFCCYIHRRCTYAAIAAVRVVVQRRIGRGCGGGICTALFPSLSIGARFVQMARCSVCWFRQVNHIHSNGYNLYRSKFGRGICIHRSMFSHFGSTVKTLATFRVRISPAFYTHKRETTARHTPLCWYRQTQLLWRVEQIRERKTATHRHDTTDEAFLFTDTYPEHGCLHSCGGVQDSHPTVVGTFCVSWNVCVETIDVC
jgi:hypothetical protein